jgi:hypothetical protein
MSKIFLRGMAEKNKLTELTKATCELKKCSVLRNRISKSIFISCYLKKIDDTICRIKKAGTF